MKVGLNDPCPCGSGKKYERCCLSSDREAESVELAAAQEEAITEMQAEEEEMEAMLEEDEELDELSNSVMDLIDAGDIDEAERVARELIECYPQVHDGYDRLGMVYEARGDKKAAADCYRKVIEFVRTHADYYEPGFESSFQDLVKKLDPSTAAEPEQPK